ncbi:hypothetical protein T11_9571, partial [Trichinella zimbabwensis]
MFNHVKHRIFLTLAEPYARIRQCRSKLFKQFLMNLRKRNLGKTFCLARDAVYKQPRNASDINFD